MRMTQFTFCIFVIYVISNDFIRKKYGISHSIIIIITDLNHNQNHKRIELINCEPSVETIYRANKGQNQSFGESFFISIFIVVLVSVIDRNPGANDWIVA